MKKNTLGILMAAILTLGIAVALATQMPVYAKDNAAAASQSKQTKAQFAIENMTCATCPISVRTAIKRVDGVKSVKIDFATKVATVTFDPSLTNAQSVADASTNVGYPATKVEN